MTKQINPLDKWVFINYTFSRLKRNKKMSDKYLNNISSLSPAGRGLPLTGRHAHPKPTVFQAVRLKKVLRLFIFMVHSVLETYSQASTLSVGKIKLTILKGIEYLSGVPTSAIPLSDTDVYIVNFIVS